MWSAPSIAQFKIYFARDFNYAPDNDPTNLNFITDNDISKACDQALINFNPGLFGNNADATIVFWWLWAFYLVYDLQTSAKGISSQSKFPISSNSVGGVSVTYSIPEKYAKEPALSVFTQNGYGMKYLSLVLPNLVGNVSTAFGTTTYT